MQLKEIFMDTVKHMLTVNVAVKRFGGWCGNGGAYGSRIHDVGRQISANETDWSEYGRGGCGCRGCGAHNGSRFGVGAYWLLKWATLAICHIYLNDNQKKRFKESYLHTLLRWGGMSNSWRDTRSSHRTFNTAQLRGHIHVQSWILGLIPHVEGKTFCCAIVLDKVAACRHIVQVTNRCRMWKLPLDWRRTQMNMNKVGLFISMKCYDLLGE